MSPIDRPVVNFDAIAHKYELENGEPLSGVSSVAKLGGADDTWGIASAWGFRVGYEGAWDVVDELDGLPADKDELRSELNRRRLTPWGQRDKAGDRGTWAHDVLEQLGQAGEVADVTTFPDEVRGHVRSLYRFYLELRPSFVALEVQVASRVHGFAGRYDVRALIDAERILPAIDPIRTDPQAERIRELAAEGKRALGLLDLKTSKRIYPETHFPQLEGYEGAGVEMGYPATDFRAVINTHPDGKFQLAKTDDDGEFATDFGVSWNTYEDFLDLLPTYKAIKRMKARDPKALRAKAQEAALLSALPAPSRAIASLNLPELAGLDSRAVGRKLGKLGKRGLVKKAAGGVWSRVED
jgi:hypothetical protein